MLDFSRTWLPYFYLYGVGGAIFLIGMFIILKARSLKKEQKRHKEWFHILIFGFLYYMGIHGLFTFAALGEYRFVVLVGIIMLAMSINLIITLFKKPRRFL